jgi:hypothetical protein
VPGPCTEICKADGGGDYHGGWGKYPIRIIEWAVKGGTNLNCATLSLRFQRFDQVAFSLYSSQNFSACHSSHLSTTSIRVMELFSSVLRPRQLPELRCDAVDNSFGPVASGCRFDFTLLFEETILFIGPSVIFLLLAMIRLWQLRRERVKTRRTFVRVGKVVSTINKLISFPYSALCCCHRRRRLY